MIRTDNDLLFQEVSVPTLYQTLWIFPAYAFLGWCTEVAYQAMPQQASIKAAINAEKERGKR